MHRKFILSTPTSRRSNTSLAFVGQPWSQSHPPTFHVPAIPTIWWPGHQGDLGYYHMNFHPSIYAVSWKGPQEFASICRHTCLECSTGIQLIPHVGFWMDYPALVMDGVQYAMQSGCPDLFFQSRRPGWKMVMEKKAGSNGPEWKIV